MDPYRHKSAFHIAIYSCPLVVAFYDIHGSKKKKKMTNKEQNDTLNIYSQSRCTIVLNPLKPEILQCMQSVLTVLNVGIIIIITYPEHETGEQIQLACIKRMLAIIFVFLCMFGSTKQ